MFQGARRGNGFGDRATRSVRSRVSGRTGQKGMPVPDQFDVSLEDSDLLGEVELTTNLIIAASETDDHLTEAEIDEILGVLQPDS
jgi:hypothetical protein